MPLRQISDINARLDAVQDLLEHPTFEAEFTELVKGLPDLERIVSRIHAKNCKVKDFLKVLSVRLYSVSLVWASNLNINEGVQGAQQGPVSLSRDGGNL